MKNNIPAIYWMFRNAWTVMHFLVVAAVATVMVSWALADSHAIRIWDTLKSNVLYAQCRASNAIPWPWATDNNRDYCYNIENNKFRSGSGASPASTTRIRVVSNINARTAPRVGADVVKVIDKGSWINADCKVDNGDRVGSGPYGPSTRWNHIEGLGYISDAYVPTNTDSLPTCR